MKKNFLPLVIGLIFNSSLLFSQNFYDIQFPGHETEQKCQQCFQVFNQKPNEVKFSIKKDAANNLFFEVNSKDWFNKLFKNSGDGIAIDIVPKKRYDCAIDAIENTQIKGELLKPVYAIQLKKGLKPFENGQFRVNVGKIPDEYINKDLEFNILFLNNKNLCRYYVIFNLESYQLNLLDTGVYLDSLTYNTKLSTASEKENYIVKYKTLKFKIPFEKNKSEYSQEDIKPLYDSLRLTDFNIKTINIRAYSSVEGSLERNIELQQQRANSIANALQTFQKPTIVTKIFSSENWVEFLNDISNTNYANLKKLNKAEIKSKLTGSTSTELEPILKNHRKAVITLELEKKDKYKEMSPNTLIDLFNNSIGDGKIEKAIDIQNSIFEKLKNKEVSPDFLNKMVVPKQAKFSTILNKNATFKYLLDERNLLISYNELKNLEKIVPKDSKVKYNIASLKFKIWRYNAMPVNDVSFHKEILSLKNYEISQTLIDRMMLNYHIIKSELYMRKGDYTNKDKSLTYIYNNLKKVTLSDSDYFSLAQFLSYYSDYNKAVELLEDKAKSIDIDEDLLFYYLNLTLINKELTQSSNYRTIMLNAINMNKERYCKLFNPSGEGGVTFQLLEDFYLRKTYCENCNK